MAQGCVYKTGRFMHQRDLVDLPLLCWQKGGDCLHRLHEHEHTRLRLAAPSVGTAPCFTTWHSGDYAVQNKPTHMQASTSTKPSSGQGVLVLARIWVPVYFLGRDGSAYQQAWRQTNGQTNNRRAEWRSRALGWRNVHQTERGVEDVGANGAEAWRVYL